jgi:hypothetical protein
MKKTVLVTSLMLVLAAGPAIAQMMGGQATPQMMEQQQEQQTAPTGSPYYNQYINPGMMGGYGGYGMGPGMMGGYGGYGMGPGMMGGYGGYGMGPGMMGNYGYRMGPGMMGGYGYGMGPGMMGNYGYGTCPNCKYNQRQQFKSNEDYSKFLNDTKEQRKRLHDMMFEYNEEMRNPNPDREKLAKMGKIIDELRSEIFNYKVK